jgi:hypothetical protein
MADGALVLAGKLAIGIACAAASALALRWRGLDALSPRAFVAASLGVALATRAALALGLYGVLDLEVLGDVLGTYVPQGRALLEGRAVYRDFSTSYGPLFPVLAAAVLALWNDPVAFVAAAIAVELAALALWIRAGRRLLDERSVRIATALYLTSPIPLLNVAMNGGNQIWVAPFLAACALLLARRDALAGVALAGSVLAVKLLGGIFAPVAWLFARERTRFALGFAAAVAGVYAAAFAWAGARVFAGLVYEAGQITPGNLYFQLSALGLDLEDPFLAAASAALLVAAGALALARLWRSGAARDPGRLPAALGVALIGFLLLSKKSYPTYLVLGFYPLCLALARARPGPWDCAVFGGLGIAATLEMSLWFRWLDTRDLALLWRDPLPGAVDRAGVLGFLACEIALLGSYVAVLWRIAPGLGLSARAAPGAGPLR